MRIDDFHLFFLITNRIIQLLIHIDDLIRILNFEYFDFLFMKKNLRSFKDRLQFFYEFNFINSFYHNHSHEFFICKNFKLIFFNIINFS